MIIDLEWDDAAYLLAVLKKHPGIQKRSRKLRSELIWKMTYYEGNTSDKMSSNIRHRVEYWTFKLNEKEG